MSRVMLWPNNSPGHRSPMTPLLLASNLQVSLLLFPSVSDTLRIFAVSRIIGKARGGSHGRQTIVSRGTRKGRTQNAPRLASLKQPWPRKLGLEIVVSLTRQSPSEGASEASRTTQDIRGGASAAMVHKTTLRPVGTWNGGGFVV